MKRHSTYAVASDNTVEALRKLEFARGVKEARIHWLPLIEEIEAYLEQRADTRDGGDGLPLPNEAMHLLTMLRENFRIDKPDSISVPSWWFRESKNEAPQIQSEIAGSSPAGESAVASPEPEPFSARLQQDVIVMMEVIRQARSECGGALSLDWHAKAERALNFQREGSL